MVRGTVSYLERMPKRPRPWERRVIPSSRRPPKILRKAIHPDVYNPSKVIPKPATLPPPLPPPIPRLFPSRMLLNLSKAMSLGGARVAIVIIFMTRAFGGEFTIEDALSEAKKWKWAITDDSDSSRPSGLFYSPLLGANTGDIMKALHPTCALGGIVAKARDLFKGGHSIFHPAYELDIESGAGRAWRDARAAAPLALRHRFDDARIRDGQIIRNMVTTLGHVEGIYESHPSRLLSACSFFSGSGLGDSGLSAAGFQILLSLDNDKGCLPYHDLSVRPGGAHLTVANALHPGNFVDKFLSEHGVDLLLWTPVCAATAAPGKHEDFDSKVNQDAVRALRDRVRGIKPSAVILENSQHFESSDTYREYCLMMKEEGFEIVFAEQMDASRYGALQMRVRFLVVWLHLGREPRSKQFFVKPTGTPPTRNAADLIIPLADVPASCIITSPEDIALLDGTRAYKDHWVKLGKTILPKSLPATPSGWFTFRRDNGVAGHTINAKGLMPTIVHTLDSHPFCVHVLAGGKRVYRYVSGGEGLASFGKLAESIGVPQGVHSRTAAGVYGNAVAPGVIQALAQAISNALMKGRLEQSKMQSLSI